MLPLSSQVQIASDNAKGATGRLSGREIPKFEDSESTFDELKARIAKTVDFISSVGAGEIDGSEEKEIVLTIGGNPMTFTGQSYLVNFALPNFYFHVTTAYDILRHKGVPIGKRDYMGADLRPPARPADGRAASGEPQCPPTSISPISSPAS